jgi:hypothetical protein
VIEGEVQDDENLRLVDGLVNTETVMMALRNPNGSRKGAR